ncbi:hypothetical protein KFU94_42460 [Chloroflexi bacterium TSY]|nr:hypothetical protein [Chloroflexi bacterium TSY]
MKILLGEQGCLYQIEVGPSAVKHFMALPKESRFTLLQHMRDIVRHGINPSGFDPAADDGYAQEDWSIIKQGQDAIHTIPLAGGIQAKVPANYVLLRPKSVEMMHQVGHFKNPSEMAV